MSLPVFEIEPMFPLTSSSCSGLCPGLAWPPGSPWESCRCPWTQPPRPCVFTRCQASHTGATMLPHAHHTADGQTESQRFCERNRAALQLGPKGRDKTSVCPTGNRRHGKAARRVCHGLRVPSRSLPARVRRKRARKVWRELDVQRVAHIRMNDIDA